MLPMVTVAKYVMQCVKGQVGLLLKLQPLLVLVVADFSTLLLWFIDKSYHIANVVLNLLKLGIESVEIIRMLKILYSPAISN